MQNFETNDCEVDVQPAPDFIRCDCNNDDKCDLADAAGVIQAQFGDFDPDCEDACDANDDGKINLADAVFILNYLFKFGDMPDPPFPDPGMDPTEDDLGCLKEDAECP